MKGRIIYHRDGRKSFLVDGKEVDEKTFDVLFPSKVDEGAAGSSLIGWKPLISDAAACHPKQVEEAVALAKARGVPTEFLPDGRPIFTSRSHRKEYLKVHGFRDNDGGYGD